MYTCCVTKEEATDCAEVELVVLAICDTDNEEQYTVSNSIVYKGALHM